MCCAENLSSWKQSLINCTPKNRLWSRLWLTTLPVVVILPLRITTTTTTTATTIIIIIIIRQYFYTSTSITWLSSEAFYTKRLYIFRLYRTSVIILSVSVTEIAFFYSFNRCLSQKEIRLWETPYCLWKCMHTVSEVENLKPLCTQRGRERNCARAVVDRK